MQGILWFNIGIQHILNPTDTFGVCLLSSTVPEWYAADCAAMCIDSRGGIAARSHSALMKVLCMFANAPESVRSMPRTNARQQANVWRKVGGLSISAPGDSMQRRSRAVETCVVLQVQR
jgi:hypothetical protein